MKSLKALCAIGFASLIFSCAHKEDVVAFYIDSELNENLTIQSRPENSTAAIFENTQLNLKSSESYKKYIQRLEEIQITSLKCDFSDYQGIISNGKLFIDGMLLGDFDGSKEHIVISDPKVLSSIADKFLEKTSLEFYFVGESNTTHFLSVDIEIEMSGTFVH